MTAKEPTFGKPENAKAAERVQSVERGLTGRRAFAKSLLAADPIAKSREMEQMEASTVIVTTILSLHSAQTTVNEYRTKIVEQAERIVAARAESRTVSAPAEKPKLVHDLTTNRGLLLATFDKMGVTDNIIEERRTESSTIFIISVGTVETRRMWVKDEFLIAADPIAEVEKVAAFLGFGKTKEEEKREQGERRRYSKPTVPVVMDLEIEPSALKDRNLIYNGFDTMLGVNMFTYNVEAIGSTFPVTSNLKGQELLSFLDSKVFEMHKKALVPMPSKNLEVAASVSKSSLDLIADEELRTVAKTLHYLALRELDETLPKEYGEAVARIQLSTELLSYIQLLNEVPYTNEDAKEFRIALGVLDHPSQAMARTMWRGMASEQGAISEEDKGLILTEMKACDGYSGVCEAALRNIAQTYTLIADDEAYRRFDVDKVASWDYDKLQSMHLQMMFSIRKAAKDMAKSAMGI